MCVMYLINGMDAVSKSFCRVKFDVKNLSFIVIFQTSNFDFSVKLCFEMIISALSNNQAMC